MDRIPQNLVAYAEMLVDREIPHPADLISYQGTSEWFQETSSGTRAAASPNTSEIANDRIRRLPVGDKIVKAHLTLQITEPELLHLSEIGPDLRRASDGVPMTGKKPFDIQI